MADDFPAAHSMDTRWYAIDAEGHVASFYSGEVGAVPVAAFPALRAAPAGGIGTTLINLLAPDPAAWAYAEWSLAAAEFGLFDYVHAHRFEYPHHFEYLNWEGQRVSGPYARRAVPPRPIHVDQLPPIVRAVVAAVRLDGLTFAEEQAIQPADLVPCQSEQAEYLTLAGERRPFPE
jgi:hypothetical protein